MISTAKYSGKFIQKEYPNIEKKKGYSK